MKFQRKDKWIQIRITPEKHSELQQKAQGAGRTIVGMIRFALLKVFGISI